MSGSGKDTSHIWASGDPKIDGILFDEAWRDSTLTYRVPVSQSEYGAVYGAKEQQGFLKASTMMAETLGRSLDIQAGTAADDGFSFEGFTNQDVSLTLDSNAHIRLAQTSSDPYGYGTAWGYFPGGYKAAGDIWTSNVSFDYTKPRPGNYANITLIHELGHALGLEHGHEATTYGKLPFAYDAMEYSVMTYRSYAGGSSTRFSNESWGYAQSFMMLDIAALQYLYGADFTTNSDDTVYSWTPGSGQTLVNGGIGINPGANRIFATIWDGGGNDTYNLSAYDNNVSLDLSPGGHSFFGTAQLARLGSDVYALGNIYNALLYQGDTRSLIENAIGGTGNDTLSGNQADNRLEGGKGRDTLSGKTGNDHIFGQQGKDALSGGAGKDRLYGGHNNDQADGNKGSDILRGGRGNDDLFGGNGKDKLIGNAGDDLLNGGAGTDKLIGNAGRDVFRFTTASHSPDTEQADLILDFLPGVDRIDLSDLTTTRFNFLGSGEFSGVGPDVIFEQSEEVTRVRADVDGDGVADLRIDLIGTLTLSETDFVL